MRNKAMFMTKDDFNEFTLELRHRTPTLVTLRNGKKVTVVFEKDKYDEDSEWSFHTANWSMCWNNDGSSITSDDFDIVEF
jgi:hypothetical protein